MIEFRKAFIILFLLYAMQGAFLHFFGMALPLIFAEIKMPLDKLSYYSLTTISFSLKILFAPFVDIFYSPKFGKRKSYIIPINYIVSALFIFYSFYLEEMVINQDMLSVGLLSFVCCFFIAVQDVAVDSWALEMMPDRTDQASMVQSVGMIVGGSIITGVGFSVLHSYNMISIQIFMLLNGIIWLTFNVYLHFFVEEISLPDVGQQEIKTKLYLFKELIDVIKNMWKNKTMRLFLLLLVVEKVWLQPVDSTYRYKLIYSGISKAIISTIDTMIFPIKLLGPIIFTRYFAKYNNIKYQSKFLIYKFFESGLVYIGLILIQSKMVEGIIKLISIIIGYLAYFIIFMSNSLWYNTYSVMHLVKVNFFFTIVTPGFEGTVITALNSVNNIGNKFSSSLALYLAAQVNFDALVISGFTLHLIYCFWVQKKYEKFSSMDKKEFSLKDKKKLN